MKKAKVSHKGRVCKFPCCKAVLSIYNHGRYCHIHLDKMVDSNKLKVSRF